MAQEAAGRAPIPGASTRRQPSGPPPRGEHAGTYGALDLGTNNCRLLIARPAGDSFVIVDAFSRIVRLGEGLLASGRLSDAAMDRAVAALAVCAEKLRRRRVTLVRSVATEACRRAENGGEFVARVARETGIRLDVIAPAEEARLAVLGCQALIEPGDGPALVFDIGGGSTELALIEAPGRADPVILAWTSAPIGVVSLTESEPDARREDVDHRAVYARMRARARDAFAGFAGVLPRDVPTPRLMGTSGTVTTLASVHLGLPAYDRRAVDGLVVPAAAMRVVSERLSAVGVAARATIPCIGTERADLVVAGCAILEEILDIWPAERLGIADRGIREGILRTLIARGAGPVRTPRGGGGRERVRTARGRTASSTRWLERQLNDPYVRRAQAEGYRSRAAYKLLELDERFALLRGVSRVIDLGAAPGGWTQVVRRRRPGATLVGIDLLAMDPIDGAALLQLDFLDEATPARLAEALGGAADLVLSDMAANTVGHPQTDHLRTMALVEAAAHFAGEVLRPGGAFVAKVFAGGADAALLATLKRRFATVRHAKPAASRKESSEVYLVAQGFKEPVGKAPDA